MPLPGADAVGNRGGDAGTARRDRETGPVDVEDAAAALVTFASGAYGVLETSRVAIGKRVSLQIEVYGSRGSADWDLERPDEFRVCLPGDPFTFGFRRVLVNPGHPGAAELLIAGTDGTSIGWLGQECAMWAEFIGGDRRGPARLGRFHGRRPRQRRHRRAVRGGRERGPDAGRAAGRAVTCEMGETVTTVDRKTAPDARPCPVPSRAGRSRRPSPRSSSPGPTRYRPGGVQGEGRSATPYPLFMTRAQGSRIWDVDGNEYIDFHSSFGAVLLGHNDPRINAAVRRAMDEHGVSFSTANPLEVELAERLIEMIPSAERVVFSCTGTEATYHAIRLARGFTGRERILKFEGNYHGWHDYVAWSHHFATDEGGGVPTPVAASAGIPAASATWSRSASTTTRRASATCSPGKATRSPR